MLEDLTFLEEGRFTKKDENIRRIARVLKQSGKDLLYAVTEYLNTNISTDYSKEEKKIVFRQRTASQIIDSRKATGCTDLALVFIVLARELGIPAIYVETFEQEWASNPDWSYIQGHIFVDILVEGCWRAYEPKTGFTPDNKYILNGRRYIEFGRGLDFSEIYIKDTKEEKGYKPVAVDLQTREEAEAIFKKQ